MFPLVFSAFTLSEDRSNSYTNNFISCIMFKLVVSTHVLFVLMFLMFSTLVIMHLLNADADIQVQGRVIVLKIISKFVSLLSGLNFLISIPLRLA